MATQAATQAATHATDPTTGIYPLGELEEFAVAEGFPDIRGWTVYGADRQRVGTVGDILIDLSALSVRYLDVQLDGGAAGAGGGAGHVLLPLGITSTDGAQRVVLADLPAARVAALPAYTRGGALGRGYEDTLLRGLAAWSGAGARTAAQTDEEYYDRPEFATGRFYGGFTRGAGAGAGVPVGGATGVTPAGSPAEGPAGAATAGDEIRVVAMGEEAVVTTRRVVKEVLVIKRRRVVEQQEVEYDLRTEHVDVEQPAQRPA